MPFAGGRRGNLGSSSTQMALSIPGSPSASSKPVLARVSNPSTKPEAASSRIFTPAHFRALAQAAKTIASFLDSVNATGVVLCIGNSPSWIYHTLIALGLHKGRAWKPVQLPISGNLTYGGYVARAQPTTAWQMANHDMLECYAQHVLKPIWPTGIPDSTYVVDYTMPHGGRWSSVDMVELLFQAIAKEHYHQDTVPRFTLLRLYGKEEVNEITNGKHNPQRVPVGKLIIVHDPVGGSTVDKQPFWDKLVNDKFPRGLVEYPFRDWKDDYKPAQRQLEASQGFQACMKDIRSYTQGVKTRWPRLV